MKHFNPTALTLLARVAVLVAAVAVWVIVLLLLLEVSRTLIDTLRFIVELGAMN